jgi:hypothetical protein
VAAKSHGELSTKLGSVDIRMGKPGWGHAQSPLPEHIGQVEGTGETETSKYPEEKKATCDSLSSGERNGKSLNRDSGTACRRCCHGVVGPARRNGSSSKELQN